MTPQLPELPDVDWKEAGGFLAFLAGLGAILRWLFLPLITTGLRNILKDDLKKMHDAIDKIHTVASDMEEMREDAREVREIACDNRDWMIDTHNLIDHLWGIDRREDPERRHLPPLPRIPDRRHRIRRKDEP